jgi:hypothetical protein
VSDLVHIVFAPASDTGKYYRCDSFVEANKFYTQWHHHGYYLTNSKYCRKCLPESVGSYVQYSLGQIQPCVVDDVCIVNALVFHIDESIPVGNTAILLPALRAEALLIASLRTAGLAKRLGLPVVTYNGDDIAGTLSETFNRFDIEYRDITL